MEKLMTTQQVADFTGFARRTLEDWRLKGKGPEFVTIAKRVRYKPQEVRAWLDGLPGREKGGE